jgi:(aminoalkyl)phosphonate N-acetyltransferase
MVYTIRMAEEKDSRIIYDFICALEETRFVPDAFEIIYRENIHSNDCVCLVAESPANGIVGFINCHIQHLLHHCGKVAEIQELFVAEQYRGTGIGHHLTTAAEREIQLRGCVNFEVTAQNKRTDTHQFYERLGFVCTHRKFVKSLS